MLLPLIEGCEQVGWRMVIKFEGGVGTGRVLRSNFQLGRFDMNWKFIFIQIDLKA